MKTILPERIANRQNKIEENTAPLCRRIIDPCIIRADDAGNEKIPYWIQKHRMRLKRIGELRSAKEKPIVVYPNSGEDWDAEHRCWTGVGNPAIFGALASERFAEGAQIVGGCCRTGPAQIHEVADAAVESESRMTKDVPE